MLSLDMQFKNQKLDVGDLKIARFDVQDVIVADMEVFDDNELGMILVDPSSKSIDSMLLLWNAQDSNILQTLLRRKKNIYCNCKLH